MFDISMTPVKNLLTCSVIFTIAVKNLSKCHFYDIYHMCGFLYFELVLKYWFLNPFLVLFSTLL